MAGEYEKKEEKADKLKQKKRHEYAVKGLKRCVDSEAIERAKMLDDLRFATLDQWPAEIRNEREGDKENGPRPCLTIDHLNQYIVQVVNDMRQGKPSIKVRPVDDAADVETAKVLQGLVRNIEDQSSADIAYMTAGESACKIGLGYFRITTEYADDDTADQVIVVKSIPNTFSTYLGAHVMPDGSDAEEAYIVEQMPKREFEAKYPKAQAEGQAFDDLGDAATFWKTEDTITVVEHFCLEKEHETLLFLADGSTVTKEEYDAFDGEKPQVQDERIKTRKRLYWCKMTGAEVLEERELPGKYIPIVEVIGRETHVDGERRLWGLVRPSKDSLRMYNYWASTITERMALAPKTPYVGAVGQFAGLEDRWKRANRVNFSYLEYNIVDVNGNPLPAPRREQPAQIEVAMVQQLALIKEDVKASLGMYKAALGESESQQSGRAILALQRESDTGTYHFGANLGISIRHAGRIIVDMIPHYYDTKRVVRILGEDGEIQAVQIDPEQEESRRQVTGAGGAIRSIYNPGVGQFDVTTTVGPSYNTKRMEAAATFVELAKGAADPASAAVLRYLTVQNSDFAGSDVAAKMLKSLLPPQAADPNEPIPPRATAQMQQMGAQMQAMQEEMQKLAQRNQQLEAGLQEAAMRIQAEKQVEAVRLQSEERLERMRMAMEERDRQAEARLAEAEARREADFERWKALLEASTKIDVAQISAGATLQAAQMQSSDTAARTQ
jgi:hypothetical protein